MIVLLLLLVVVCLWMIRWIYSLFQSEVNPEGKYVFVSGCDTGIGHALVIELDRKGFHVFASVLHSTNIQSLKEKLSSRAQLFSLDITQDDQIQRVYALIRSQTDSLYGLVNNAGIITHGPIEWTSMDQMRQIIEVNFYGHVALTKRFLPLLIERSHSRLINVISAAGFYTFPNTSAYSASKHALKAFNDCLRREMSPWNLHVSSIEPGALRTTMLQGLEKNLRETWKTLPLHVQDRWGENYLNDFIKKSIESPFLIYADHPDRVVRNILDALINPSPKRSYHPGWQAKFIFYFLNILPTWISDEIIARGFNILPRALNKKTSEDTTRHIN